MAVKSILGILFFDVAMFKRIAMTLMTQAFINLIGLHLGSRAPVIVVHVSSSDYR